jgi:hypothetical protein
MTWALAPPTFASRRRNVHVAGRPAPGVGVGGRAVGFATVSEQLLALLKFSMLGLVYLFLFRVVRAVWAELAPPRRADDDPASHSASGGSRRSVPSVRRHGGSGVPQSAPPTGAATPVVPPVAMPSPMPGAQATGSELVVVAPAEMAGNRYSLTGAELTVGRGGGCSVTLDDSFVSQLHARLYMADGRWLVEDLGSTNGTWVNADRVGGTRALAVGDHLAMGSVVMELR